MNNINLKIPGDYVNSFIYSGLLFLVKTSGEVLLIDWRVLIGKKNIDGFHLKFINNCAVRLNRDFEDLIIEFDESDLRDCTRDKILVDFWVNDFIIYSNILYFSGQDGVEVVGLNFDEKKFIKENRRFIYDKRSYRLASSKNRGVAIAAGNNGVILKNINKYLNEVVSPKVVEEDSIDVEWSSNALVVNSYNKAKVNFYNDVEDVDYKKLSSLEKSKFFQKKITADFEETYDGYSWVIGDRLFNFKNGSLGRSNLKNKNFALEEFHLASTEVESDYFSKDFNFDFVRSASFGCIVDVYDKIFLLNDFGFQEMAEGLTKWKVFPRAKNYVNHLHMIGDDSLNVKIFARRDMISRKYGISPSNVD